MKGNLFKAATEQPETKGRKDRQKVGQEEVEQSQNRWRNRNKGGQNRGLWLMFDNNSKRCRQRWTKTDNVIFFNDSDLSCSEEQSK